MSRDEQFPYVNGKGRSVLTHDIARHLNLIWEKEILYETFSASRSLLLTLPKDIPKTVYPNNQI